METRSIFDQCGQAHPVFYILWYWCGRLILWSMFRDSRCRQAHPVVFVLWFPMQTDSSCDLRSVISNADRLILWSTFCDSQCGQAHSLIYVLKFPMRTCTSCDLCSVIPNADRLILCFPCNVFFSFRLLFIRVAVNMILRVYGWRHEGGFKEDKQ